VHLAASSAVHAEIFGAVLATMRMSLANSRFVEVDHESIIIIIIIITRRALPPPSPTATPHHHLLQHHTT